MPSVTNSTAVLLCIDLLMLISVKVCSLTRGMQMTLLLFDFDCCYVAMPSVLLCLQCFDAVGWVAGRASGL